MQDNMVRRSYGPARELRSAIIAAIVAALVASGSTFAATYISGRSIRPHSIPLNRLAHRPIGKTGPQGLAGPVGQKGDPGIEGERGLDGSGITNVLFSSVACQSAGGYAVSYGPPNQNGNPSGHFEVCDGATGAVGPVGPVGPQGPQGDPGTPGTPGLGNATGILCVSPANKIGWGGFDGSLCDEGDTQVEVVLVSAG